MSSRGQKMSSGIDLSVKEHESCKKILELQCQAEQVEVLNEDLSADMIDEIHIVLFCAARRSRDIYIFDFIISGYFFV